MAKLPPQPGHRAVAYYHQDLRRPPGPDTLQLVSALRCDAPAPRPGSGFDRACETAGTVIWRLLGPVRVVKTALPLRAAPPFRILTKWVPVERIEVGRLFRLFAWIRSFRKPEYRNRYDRHLMCKALGLKSNP